MAAGEDIGSTDAAADAIESMRATALAGQARGSLRPVINATGVVIHTNLGRAPLADAAIERIASIARGYSNLEYDLDKGGRGSRTVHAESLITSITGAEAAIVVNNNAAAIMLILSGLAAGREVVISRGELVEIGGGFRIPDVMRQSGATLREVGTTNRTRITDYTASVSPATAMFLRVHPSNFRIEGFTERPSLDDLVGVGARDERAGRRRHRQRLPDRRSRRMSRRCRPRSPPASIWCASAATSCSAVRSAASSPAARRWSIGCGRIR